MSADKKKIRILFLCTGNSCRSQMAEGWARHLKGNVMEVYSAGISPATLSQRAVKVMADAGVDISGQMSKHIDDVIGIQFDYVVTVCDNAREHCPVFPGRVRRIHKAFEDPSFLPGPEDEVMAAFTKTRDQIKQFVEQMPENLETERGQGKF